MYVPYDFSRCEVSPSPAPGSAHVSQQRLVCNALASGYNAVHGPMWPITHSESIGWLARPGGAKSGNSRLHWGILFPPLRRRFSHLPTSDLLHSPPSGFNFGVSFDSSVSCGMTRAFGRFPVTGRRIAGYCEVLEGSRQSTCAHLGSVATLR